MEGLVERKQVQELAESGQGPPDRYIYREEDRPISTPAVERAVPVIDLSRLFLSDGADDEAHKLRSALQSWGLFLAIGHDMSASFLDEVRDVTKKFFQLPMREKQKYSNIKGDNEYRFEGYGNDSPVVEGQIRDWTDRLFLFVLPEDKREMGLWPENPSSFRDILHEFTNKIQKLAEHVLGVMAKLLELDRNYFIDQIGDRADVGVRFSYYPCCSRPDLVFGLRSHSDNSTITIILPDKEVEGLQVLKDSEWVKVPVVPYALLINLGDEMEIMSNGTFKSPVHRVVTNSESDRMSVSFFYKLGPEKEVGPAECLVDETRPRLYRTVKASEYKDVHIQNFYRWKRGIDWAKV